MMLIMNRLFYLIMGWLFCPLLILLVGETFCLRVSAMEPPFIQTISPPRSWYVNNSDMEQASSGTATKVADEIPYEIPVDEIPVDGGGLYLELGEGLGPYTTLGGEIGLECIDENLSARGGLFFLFSKNLDNDYFIGCNLGTRFSMMKGSISPFVGVGVSTGYSEEKVSATEDGIDNDGDDFIDERRGKKEKVDKIIATCYPEIGTYLWTSESFKLTISVRYQVTTEGREQDFWMYTMAIFFYLGQ
jgi:hypothetical protein